MPGIECLLTEDVDMLIAMSVVLMMSLMDEAAQSTVVLTSSGRSPAGLSSDLDLHCMLHH